MIRRRAIALPLLLAACPRPPPPAPAPAGEGWLVDVSESVTLRPATACERAAALGPDESGRDADDGIARTMDADLDGDGRDERLVLAIRRETVVAITDLDCVARWRGTLRDAPMQGPSLPTNPWDAVPPREIDGLYGGDRLPLGATMQLRVVRSAGGHRFVLLLRVGSTARLRYGWQALVLSCHRGACRSDALGHHEWAALPTHLGCGPTARTNRPPPHIEDPLLRVAPGADGVSLVLTPHARLRDTCAPSPDESLRALEPVRVGP